MASFELKPYTLLQGGKYKIERVLGQGGFGITYLATQELLNRKVCIKEFFFKEYCERDEATNGVSLGTQSNQDITKRFMAKFLKEARTISSLEHPNIIQIHDIFKENNTAYYVMEYIEGESLADKVRNQGVLPENEAIGYIKQVASALDFIHQRSINHLDVKPANIMVRSSDNKAILIDFGLSKQYDAQGGQTSTTPVGISHGYAPMEQYNANGISSFSPETDIYALGATLYKLLTGNTPPQASDLLNEGLPALPQALSSGARTAITHSMQVKKKDRPADIKRFLCLLDSSNSDGSKSTTNSLGGKSSNIEDEATRVLNPTPLQGKDSISDNKTNSSTNPMLWIIIIVCVILGGIIYLSNQSTSYTPSRNDTSITQTQTQNEQNTPTPPKAIQQEFNTKRYSINKNEGNFKYDVTMDYPISGNENLVYNIKEWIEENLLKDYNGSLDEPNKILEQSYKNAKNDPERASEITEQYINIYRTHNFVTYQFNGHIYYDGAAHGMSGKYGITFRAKDGRRYGWDMMTKDESLKNLIITELKNQYFKVGSDEDFFSSLIYDENPNRYSFPYPETDPWITAEGVVFQYGEYEIASYSMGKPYCVIPLSKVQKYFTSSMKRLLEQ